MVAVMLMFGLNAICFVPALALVNNAFPERTEGTSAFDVDPWSYCEGRQFETPACMDGAPVMRESNGEVEWCYLKASRTVNGASLTTTKIPICIEASLFVH